jgi:hypothetical protein
VVKEALATQGSGKRGKRVRQNGTQRSGAQVTFVEVCLVSSELESSMPCTEICNVAFYRGFPELRRKGRCRGIALILRSRSSLDYRVVSCSVFYSRQIASRNQRCVQAMEGQRL